MIIFLFTLIVAIESTKTQPFVDFDLGKVFGFDYTTTHGNESEIYLGIPYAKPPIGKLRLEKPVRIEKWNSPINTTKFGPGCIPHTKRARFHAVSEDCLTLNIIRPKQQIPEGYPVLFWVHGGGYQFGSARQYGFKGFANGYIHRNLIIVTVQYRVGPLGFLATGDSRLSGNYGLWDLEMALKFVHDHIHAFGGDPSRITVWGQSAGAAIVSQLVLSPYTRDMIQSSIEMSGSAWSHFAIGNFVPQNSMELAEALNCTDDETIKECLKSKSLDEIDDAVELIGYTTNTLRIVKWTSHIDGDFLPGMPSEMLLSAKQKPVFAGVNDKDASLYTTMCRASVIQDLCILKDEQQAFDQKALEEKIRLFITKAAEFGYNKEEAIQKTSTYYLRKDGNELIPGFFLDRYGEINSDIRYFIPFLRGVKSRQASGWSVYSYMFKYFRDDIWGPFNLSKEFQGSPHTNELAYAFDMFLTDRYEMNEVELKIKENWQNAIATFVHTGKPTWSGISWPITGDDVAYLSIGNNSIVERNMFPDAWNFWESLQNLGYDMISMSSVVEKKSPREEL